MLQSRPDARPERGDDVADRRPPAPRAIGQGPEARTLEHPFEIVVTIVEWLGVGVLSLGLVIAFGRFARSALAGGGVASYVPLRNDLGRSILLGLEVLIIADIIQTITVELTLENAAILGLIVLVRTFLSFSLEIELDGMLPWHRNRSAADVVG